MSYKKINEALSDISQLRYGGKFTKVSSDSVQVDFEGGYGEIIEIYNLGEDDLHIKLSLRTDSYGENESVHSVQIVKPIIRQVTDFKTV